MKRLAESIAGWVSNHVKTQTKYLQGGDPEYRAVFNGPPAEILRLVFQALTADGGCIEATLPNGEVVSIPVILQVEQLPEGETNPPIGKSGLCDSNYLLALRNSRGCPIFVGLVSPGQHSKLSETSTRSDFGLSPQSNVGTATIIQWWNDGFIQNLIDEALGRNAWPTNEAREDAKKLIERAVIEADEIERHDVSRRAAWAVLSRLWSISDKRLPFGTLVSLAMGYPPVADGSVDSRSQIEVLESLAARLEESHFKQGFERIKDRADSDDERLALEQVRDHLQQKCAVITALSRSISHYYGPFVGDEIGQPPPWWKLLTVERWTYLLDEDKPRKEAIKLECLNPAITQMRGLGAVVASKVLLKITLPPDTPSTQIKIVRDVGGPKNHCEWLRTVQESVEIEDSKIPVHKTPIRYSATVVDTEISKKVKDGSIRVISLSEWEPGLIVCSRTASKGTVPKKVSRKSREKVAFEPNLKLMGHGRHYLEVYLRPGVSIVDDVAYRSNEQGAVDEQQSTTISKISNNEYGFEVDATSECFYQFSILRPEVEQNETVRVYLSSDEIDPQECGSEFERMILLNTQRDGARATTDVHVNRLQRCSDLQVWMLAKDRVERSFYPLVFAPDYALDWRARDWSSAKDTVLSKGKFLNDPRPSHQEMQPPEGFIRARATLAERIRGDDGNGVVEAARLGEWLATDPAFGEVVEAYVRTYHEWLSSSRESAAWCDISIITRFEPDGSTLVQEPDAVLVSPLHPVRLAWQCLAQKVLFLAQRKRPCPAASILDPSCIPDSMVLPLRSAAGGIKWNPYFSVESSSDYWGILWNATKLDRLAVASAEPPFDQEFGISVGGVSSGFSVSQVHRALDDIFQQMFVAKPVINVLVTSASGQNNACNEGIISWCRNRFSTQDNERPVLKSLGGRFLQVMDERKHSRPEDAQISNLAEDTGNSVTWYAGMEPTMIPDLGIIAQLETSNAGNEATKIASPLGYGGLIRGRVRQQLKAGSGAFLSESRTGRARPVSGDGLADKTMAALALLENLSDFRLGYVFAPSVHAITHTLEKAEYVAVSSSAVDPACFLGGWLPGTYLWDYELPSYSSRAGDSNGYYLLSRIKALDREALRAVLSRLPGCEELADELVDQIVLEVARRGIPTVRGLSGGDTGASGDLGLFIASRMLQDAFRAVPENTASLFPVWTEEGDETQIVLVVPIDPFQGYLEDLARTIKKPSMQRPDLIVAGINISGSAVACKLTFVEVKYRSASGQMSTSTCQDALQQAKSLSALFEELGTRSDEPEMTLWKLAFQHLLASMLGYGFRVYSQQSIVSNKSERWAEHHARIVEAILSDELKLEVDKFGRLIVIDGSPQSSPRDADNDGFYETVVLSHADASLIVKGEGHSVYDVIRERIHTWEIFPPGMISSDSREVQREQSTACPGEGDASQATAPRDVPAHTPMKSDVVPMDEEDTQNFPSQELLQPPSVETDASAAQTGIDLLVGKTIDGFKQENRRLNLGDTNLNQLNIGVVGDLGTGKTQLLKSLIYQISQGGPSNRGIKPKVLIFDYKKDYSAEDFVKAVGARVVKPRHLPINLFDLSGASDSVTPWLDRFNFFADVLDKIYSGVGPVQRKQLKDAVRKAYDQCSGTGRAPTIYDIHANYQSAMAGKADSISAIIEDLVDREMFTPNPTSMVSVEEFLNGIVVISLDALGQDDRTKNMLVAIMLNIFYEHMLRIPKRPFSGTNKTIRVVDSFLLVDEADNIMRYEFDVLRKVLLQGREFGLGVILASQYLKHFKAGAMDYREPLLTWFIHKVPNVTPQELGALGLTGNVVQLADRVKSLSLHECLYKTHDIPGEIVKGTPFYKLPQ